jgi:serine/threonine protein kinase
VGWRRRRRMVMMMMLSLVCKSFRRR